MKQSPLLEFESSAFAVVPGEKLGRTEDID